VRRDPVLVGPLEGLLPTDEDLELCLDMPKTEDLELCLDMPKAEDLELFLERPRAEDLELRREKCHRRLEPRYGAKRGSSS